MKRTPVLLVLLLLLSGPASAQRTEPLPKDLQGVGITEHLDGSVPMDLGFEDETGKQVTLGQYFVKGRPVVLTLVYYSCPMLCTLVLNGLTEAMKELPWQPGHDYEVVTVSFDPSETPNLARLKKQNYLQELGRPGVGDGWPFLTGEQESIQALTRAVGFNYRWDEQQKQYAHPAAIFVLTPEGRISRYLYGVQFESKNLRLALLEASKGKIGNPVDQVLLFCYHYDANAGRYSITAQRIMLIGGVLTVLVLGTWLLSTWLRAKPHDGPVAHGPQP